MKVRLLNNSIRVRISKSELDTLKLENKLSASTQFPEGSLVYSVMTGKELNISISQDNKHCFIKITVPSSSIETMVNTDTVGFSGEILLEGNEFLSFLFEKDFKCLAPREEDESDLYPHPKENVQKC